MTQTALLIGDSISAAYESVVRELLEPDGVDVTWQVGGSSAQVLAGLAEWVAPGQSPDVIHFNCGLHDSRYFKVAGTYQQPLANYTALLRGAVDWLKANTDAQLVWATTTPVITDRLVAYWAAREASGQLKVEYVRYTDDIASYNKAARQIMDAAGVPINDLHAVVQRASPQELIADDGVHMTEQGTRLLAEAVAGAVREHMSRP